MKVGESILVPAEIIEAARRVTQFFQEHAIRGWSIDGCSDRDTVEAYRTLHMACLRLWVASSDTEDAQDRVAAPRATWKAMGDAMQALPPTEAFAIAAQLSMAEAVTMEATADKLALLVKGGRLS